MLFVSLSFTQVNAFESDRHLAIDTVELSDLSDYSAPEFNQINHLNFKIMPEISYGFKKIERGATNATTGLGETYEDIGKFLRGSVGMTQAEGTNTQILEEASDTPVAEINRKAAKSFSFSLLDTDAETNVLYMGGTTSGVAPAPLTWHEPNEEPNIEGAFRFHLKSGKIIEVHRGAVKARQEWSGAEGALITIVTVTPLKSKVEDVSSLDIINETAQPEA